MTRTEAEVRAELARLRARLDSPGRLKQYAVISLTARVETLRWVLGEETIFDGETQ